MKFPAQVSELILSERRYCRRILMTSPVGNCPISHLEAPAPLLEAETLEEVGIAKSQVK